MDCKSHVIGKVAAKPGAIFNVYVMKDDRRVTTVLILDAGPQVVLKDEKGKYHVVKKSGVKEIEKVAKKSIEKGAKKKAGKVAK